ncbi:MAG: NAD(P)-dependent oxidoreductase [Deltaproteobacteria bacterium]|nr:NAD(P)-dependent oxidoreductase [Deltaproteobacteria bacterium]
MTPRAVLVTGAAGEIGRALRAGLRGRYAHLRLSDLAPMDPAGPGEEVVQADVTDRRAVGALVEGIDAIVHLAGIACEHTWERIAAVNIGGTAHVFEAAREAGVRRVLFASSVHAVGFCPRAERVGPSTPTRPDTYYGVSKVAGEALGRLFHDKHGMEVACLRICSYQERPRERRHLSTWLSPGDMVRLVTACLDAPVLGFRILAGTSRNTRRWMTDEGWAEVGYDPRDDAEVWAAEVEHIHGPDGDITETTQGGFFTAPDFKGLAGR